MQRITDAYKAARDRFVKWTVDWAASESFHHKDPLDVIEVMKLMSAIGFKIRHTDVSLPEDVTPTGVSGEQRGGCRVIVMCTKSGRRFILETAGVECSCPQEVNSMTTDRENLIPPINEATAFVVREVVNHLANTDLNCFDTEEYSRTRNSGSIDSLSTSSRRTSAENRSLSSEDLSTNDIRTPIPRSSSLQSISETSTREDKIASNLQMAMSCIQEALKIHNSSEQKNIKESVVFKVPTSRPEVKKSSASKKLKTPDKTGLRSASTSQRKLTPFPVKKTVELCHSQKKKQEIAKPSVQTKITPTVTRSGKPNTDVRARKLF